MLIVLFGAKGQLGQAFLNDAQWQLFDAVSLNRDDLDVTNCNALNETLDKYCPDIVINCAAYTKVDNAEIDVANCRHANTDAAVNMAKWCAQHGKLFVHFSTDYVFDGKKQTPYIETDLTRAINVYGETKREAEIKIERHCEKFLIFRTSWLFGFFDSGFFKTMYKRALNQQPTAVINDQFGSPTSAEELAKLVLILLQRYQIERVLKYGIYHLAGDRVCSWFDFATQIFTSVSPGYSQLVSTLSSPYPGSLAIRPRYSCLNSALFKRTFHLSVQDPFISVDEAVQRLIRQEK